MKKKWILSVTIASVLVGLIGCTNNQSSNVIVETSAGKITKDDFYEKLKSQYGEMVIYGMVLDQVLESKYPVTDKEVEAELAKVKKQQGEQFDMFLSSTGAKDEDAYKAMLRTQLIQDKALASYINIPEEDLKKRYAEKKPEIQASHILIKDEKVAKDVLAKVKAGEDFAGLAKEFSEDPGSAANGGDLGYFGPGLMMPTFEEAAYALKVGEISDLVKTDFGYHIIKLTDRKEVEPFDKMKNEIQKEIIEEKVQEDPATVQGKIMNELKSADIEVKDEDLKGIFDFILKDNEEDKKEKDKK